MKSTAIKTGMFSFFMVMLFLTSLSASEDKTDKKAEPNISPQTQACIECHETYTPGIVHDWLSSRHSKVTPSDAMKKPALERRISTDKLPLDLSGHVVGCYECHSRNPEKHKDNFEHMGNVVVTPNDCSACHPVEVKQYSGSKKAHAIKNLTNNPVYHALVSTITGVKKIEKGKIISEKPSDETLNETCFACHGTKIEVRGMKNVSTQRRWAMSACLCLRTGPIRE